MTLSFNLRKNRYPDLPVVDDGTAVCLRGPDNICKAIDRAKLDGLTSITRVVGGGSTHSNLKTLLHDHKIALRQLASISPDKVSYPDHEWKYVPIKRVSDLLGVDDVTEIIPRQLHYSGSFNELLPQGLLLAAEVVIITSQPDENHLRKDTFIMNTCNSYAKKAMRLGTKGILGDMWSPQFTYGTIGKNPSKPKYYLHDIEPRMIRIN